MILTGGMLFSFSLYVISERTLWTRFIHRQKNMNGNQARKMKFQRNWKKTQLNTKDMIEEKNTPKEFLNFDCLSEGCWLEQGYGSGHEDPILTHLKDSKMKFPGAGHTVGLRISLWTQEIFHKWRINKNIPLLLVAQNSWVVQADRQIGKKESQVTQDNLRDN